jgi:hypothetical protein
MTRRPMPGATVTKAGDGIVVVGTSFRQAGVFVTSEAQGSSYVITAGPSLTVAGTGTAADGARFVRVGPAPYNTDADGRGFFSVFDAGGIRWAAIASVTDNDGTPKSIVMIGPAGALQHNDGDGDGDTPTAPNVFGGPAELTLAPDGAVVATVKDPASKVVVTAYVTDPIAFTVAALPKQA